MLLLQEALLLVTFFSPVLMPQSLNFTLLTSLGITEVSSVHWIMQGMKLCYCSDWETEHDNKGSRGGAVVRALASNQCGPGTNARPVIICGLSLLLVLVLTPRVFLWVLRFSSLPKNQHFQIPIRSGIHGPTSL